MVDLIVCFEVEFLGKYGLKDFGHLWEFVYEVDIDRKEAGSSFEDLIGFFEDWLISK